MEVMNILVLDDDACVVDAMRSMLQAKGHHVDCVDHALAALRLMRKRTYDMVFFDYVMPDKDGLWFLEHADVPARTTAVLMTGYGTADLINNALELGASGYILKPFTIDQLTQHMEFYAKRERTGRSRHHESLALSTAQ